MPTNNDSPEVVVRDLGPTEIAHYVVILAGLFTTAFGHDFGLANYAPLIGLAVTGVVTASLGYARSHKHAAAMAANAAVRVAKVTQEAGNVLTTAQPYVPDVERIVEAVASAAERLAAFGVPMYEQAAQTEAAPAPSSAPVPADPPRDAPNPGSMDFSQPPATDPVYEGQPTTPASSVTVTNPVTLSVQAAAPDAPAPDVTSTALPVAQPLADGAESAAAALSGAAPADGSADSRYVVVDGVRYYRGN